MSDLLVTCGCDPGFSKFGIAILQLEDKKISIVSTRLIETQKSDKKTMRDLRVSADDQRRLKTFWDVLIDYFGRLQIKAAGIESYCPFPGQAGGSAWKVGFAYEMAVCACWAKNVTPMIFRPDDLKRRFLNKKSGSKLEIEEAIVELVSGAREELDKYPKTKREHIADAIGHAYLAMEELQKMRSMYSNIL